MIKFKQLREKTKIARAPGDSGEETKLNDLPSDESQLDDVNTNGRNPEGSAESQVNKSIKPIYVKTSDGTYTLATESYANTKTAILTQMKPKTDKERVARIAELQKRAKKGDLVAASHLTPNQKGRKRERGDVVREDKTNEEVDEGIIGRATRAIGNIKDKRITSKDDAARKEKRKSNFKKRLKDANREAQWEREDGRKGDSPGTRIKDAQSYAASRSEPSDKAREAAKRIKARRIRQGAEDRRKANEEVVNENTIDDIKKIVTLDQPGTVRFSDGSSAKIRPESAQAILQTHGNLNTNNQRKFAEKLSASASGFSKLEKFSLQQAKLAGRLYQLNNL